MISCTKNHCGKTKTKNSNFGLTDSITNGVGGARYMENQASFTLVLPEEEEEESMCIWLSHEKRPYFVSSFIHLPMYVVYVQNIV